MAEANQGVTLESGSGVAEERKGRLSIALPRDILATIAGYAKKDNLRQHQLVEKLLRWGLEDIDPQTGTLPNIHPGSRRTQEKVLSDTKLFMLRR